MNIDRAFIHYAIAEKALKPNQTPSDPNGDAPQMIPTEIPDTGDGSSGGGQIGSPNSNMMILLLPPLFWWVLLF
jgi:hypothetical protein